MNTLDQLDPVDAWKPWTPSAAEPWGRKWAAHLYRRAGFGPSREDLLTAERLGFEGTLDLLLKGKPGSEADDQSLDDDGRFALGKGGLDAVRGWWVYRMLRGPHPLREKMTLFWHNHFATSAAKAGMGEAAMFQQNLLLRNHSLGKFGPFLQAMSKDEAMLVWLDSNQNVKGKPNENYAREVMELFSLGVGNYTEKDVQEAARAFTGWKTGTSGYYFNSAEHDYGGKTVLGSTGEWNGEDVVRIILEQPTAARFLVRKLYHFLVSETAVPPDAFIEPLCAAYRASDYDTASLLKTMLGSRHFFSAHAFRQRIKGPAEFVLGAVRAVYRNYPEDDVDYSALPHQALVPCMIATGQKLFEPPNVKGWPGAKSWLNTSTMLERDNFAGALATGTLWNGPSPPGAGKPPPAKALDPARLLEEEKVSKPKEVVTALLDLYVPGGVRPEVQAKLEEFLSEGNPKGSTFEKRVREAVHAIMTMPEYQLA
jgi:hypothetical protein